MITKETNCPKCNKLLEYWTLKEYIECTACKNVIGIEPCDPDVVVQNNFKCPYCGDVLSSEVEECPACKLEIVWIDGIGYYENENMDLERQID